ncbi:hypothetical protein EG028_27115 [Chitinophaga barathri]|uniref:Uncharacterized protein n=1 Tax=Chitinophaga barathri TaxID=1647451 RepID=A0A3N4M9M6_9BACT|nr:hypothetical protein EG028_27115 [Chitinophaga barathri]
MIGYFNSITCRCV